MNNAQRKQKRYERRVLKRALHIKERCEQLPDIKEIFSFNNMMFYGNKCCNGVRWKQSVQMFELFMLAETAKNIEAILDETWFGSRCVHFVINERGKTRPIDAPLIADRQIHKLECNEILIPLYKPTIITENGASQHGKGLHWHFRLLKQHLRYFYRHYGRTGWIVLIDIKHFFPDVPLQVIYDRHNKYITTPKIKQIADRIIDSSPHTDNKHGMPLGIETSQQEMIASPSAIDHYIKCQLGIKCMAHYMDDYYLFARTKSEAEHLLELIIKKFEQFDFKVNRHKCHILPMTKPFKWCKCKFTLKETGKIVMNGCRGGIKRARRKIKLFRSKLNSGEMTFKKIKEAFNSQIAYYKNYNDHGRILRLKRLFYSIFKSEILNEKSQVIIQKQILYNYNNNNLNLISLPPLPNHHIEYTQNGFPFYVSEVKIYYDGNTET